MAGALIELGVVGVNIEDGVVAGSSRLTPAIVLSERIAAIRTAAERAGVPLFINARTDTYFVPNEDPSARVEDTMRRARQYIEAGADGIFVPGITDLAEMADLAQRIARPLNIYAGFAGGAADGGTATRGSAARQSRLRSIAVVDGADAADRTRSARSRPIRRDDRRHAVGGRGQSTFRAALKAQSRRCFRHSGGSHNATSTHDTQRSKRCGRRPGASITSSAVKARSRCSSTAC